MQITLKPWAKINLYLKVLGKGADGYHQLLTLLHPIALFDKLTVKNSLSGIKINCTGSGLPHFNTLPKGTDNLVGKAAHLFFKYINKNPSVEIDLEKRIPIGGGLGGGSSDAVCTLRGLNQLFDFPLGDEAIYQMCVELGMDAPFFLLPKPAVCINRGEVIKERFESKKFWCILVNPGISLATKKVYKALNLNLTGSATNDIISRFPYYKTFNNLKDFIYNDLEDTAKKLCPEIDVILNILKKAGAAVSFVSGSGATVCGLAESKEKAGEVMRQVVAKGSSKWWVEVVSSL